MTPSAPFRVRRLKWVTRVSFLVLLATNDALAVTRIGASGGFTSGKLTQEFESGSAVNGPAFSMLVFVPVSGWLSLGTEPTIWRKGMAVNYSRFGDVDVHATVLDVPLLLRTSARPGIGLFGEIGANIAFPLSSGTSNPALVPDVGAFKNPTFGLVVGAGFEWRMGSSWSPFVGVQFARDLSTTYQNPDLFPYEEGARSRALRIRLGFLHSRPR
jgi:hypothetical protein